MIKGRKIIIWGKDNYNVLGLLRQLKDYQYQIVLLLIGKKQYCATLSRYCHNKVFVKDVKAGYDYLIKNNDNETLKPIIIPTNDLVAECIDNNQDILKEKYLFSFSENKSLSTYLDKMVMHDIAQSCDITTPKSYYLSDDLQAKKVGFPCIIKPIKKLVGIPLQFKTMVCEDENILKEVIASVEDINNYMIQEYIDKESDYLIFGCRKKNGDIIMPCVLKKERWYNGDGSYGIIQPEMPEFINKEGIKQFLNKTNYHGLFSFEYGISKGKSYYYETNFRNDGTSHYFYQAGINIPMCWVLDLCDEKNEVLLTGVENEKVFIDEVYDYHNVVIKKINKAEWKKEYKKATVFKYYDKKDRLPYYYQILFNTAYKIYNAFK